MNPRREEICLSKSRPRGQFAATEFGLLWDYERARKRAARPGGAPLRRTSDDARSAPARPR